MAVFSKDGFVDPTDTYPFDLSLHIEDTTGGTWTQNASSGAGSLLVSLPPQVHSNNSTTAAYYTSESPATADYTVQADLVPATAAGSAGVAGRLQAGADTMYFMRYRQAVTLWELGKVIAGAVTVISSASATLVNGNTYTHSVQMVGTSLTGAATGISNLTATDGGITLKGNAGIRGFGGTDFPLTGYQWKNFSATDYVAASNVKSDLVGHVQSGGACYVNVGHRMYRVIRWKVRHFLTGPKGPKWGQKYFELFFKRLYPFRASQ